MLASGGHVKMLCQAETASGDLICVCKFSSNSTQRNSLGKETTGTGAETGCLTGTTTCIREGRAGNVETSHRDE